MPFICHTNEFSNRLREPPPEDIVFLGGGGKARIQRIRLRCELVMLQEVSGIKSTIRLGQVSKLHTKKFIIFQWTFCGYSTVTHYQRERHRGLSGG